MRTDCTKVKYQGLALRSAIAILAALTSACGQVPDHFKKPDGSTNQALLATAGIYGMTVQMTRDGSQIELAIHLTVKDRDFDLNGVVQGTSMQASGQTPNGASQVTASVECADATCATFAVLLQSQGNATDANASSSAAVLYMGSRTDATATTPCTGLWTEAPVSYATAADALTGLQAAYTTLGANSGGTANAGGGGTTTPPQSGGTSGGSNAATQGGSFTAPPDPTL